MKYNGTQVTIEELIHMRALAKRIQFSHYKKLLAMRSGDHNTIARGRGIEFEEVRSYQAGDDVSVMDWRVTARTGKPHVKVFREERDLPLVLVVDLRQNMFFGTRKLFKSVQASRIAATIAWAALQHGDRVGCIILKEDKIIPIKVCNNKSGVLHILNQIVKHQPTQITPINDQAKQPFPDLGATLKAMTHPGASALFISDFFRLNEDSASPFIHRLHIYNFIHFFIYDPIEQSPPPPNLYAITDGQKKAVIDTFSKSFCDTYQNCFDTHFAHVKHFSHRHQRPLYSIATDEDILMKLHHGHTNELGLKNA